MILSNIMGGKINKSLYKQAVLYFIKYCNNQYLGKTKLNKLLYYLDFISYRDFGSSATGDIYIHKDYGPVPASVDNILAELSLAGDIETSITDYLDGETYNFKITRENSLNEDAFSEEQKNLLRNICDEFSSWSTDKIVNQTHLEAPWFYSKPYEIVNFDYAKDIEFFIK